MLMVKRKHIVLSPMVNNMVNQNQWSYIKWFNQLKKYVHYKNSWNTTLSDIWKQGSTTFAETDAMSEYYCI